MVMLFVSLVSVPGAHECVASHCPRTHEDIVMHGFSATRRVLRRSSRLAFAGRGVRMTGLVSSRVPWVAGALNYADFSLRRKAMQA